MFDNEEFSLSDLFHAADEIGKKYQSSEEIEAHKTAVNEVNSEIIREAIARGEYDQEKGTWFL